MDVPVVYFTVITEMIFEVWSCKHKGIRVCDVNTLRLTCIQQTYTMHKMCEGEQQRGDDMLNYLGDV